MNGTLVALETTDTATIIRLNRPARHNALVPELLEQLLDALRDERSLNTCAIILAAEGRSFSTGGDLLGFWQHRDNIADYAQILVGLLNDVILALYTHSVPVVCAVQGQVTGGSLGLLLSADRVVMQRDVRITPWYATVGFTPDGGWTALLPDIIGRQRASSWLASDDSVSAEECLVLGIAHEVVEDDSVAAALAWARRVANADAASVRSARLLLRDNAAELDQKLESERATFVERIQTQAAIAGIARFLGKKL